MTLATLKGMNFNMGDVANALKLKAADTVVTGVQKVAETAAGAAGRCRAWRGRPRGARHPAQGRPSQGRPGPAWWTRCSGGAR
jgi:hypothetical protein